MTRKCFVYGDKLFEGYMVYKVIEHETIGIKERNIWHDKNSSPKQTARKSEEEMTRVKSSGWSKRRALQEKDPTEVYEVARSIQERTVRRSKD